MGYFRSEEEFWECYKRFNALYGGSWNGWKPTQARIKHEDIFGFLIAAGDMYFRKQTSHTFGSTFSLSMKAMEKVLLIVMVENRDLNQLGERLLQNQREAMVKKLSIPEGLGAPPSSPKPNL